MSRAAEGRSGGRRGLVVALTVAAIVAAALVAALTMGGGPEAREVAEVGFAETTGGVLPPMPRSGTDPAIGVSAPTVRAMTFADERVDMVPGGGRSLVVGFFAHWCPHCQAELPRLTAWLRANDPPDGVEVVAVSTSVEAGAPNYPPSAWFDQVGWPELVLRDSPANSIATGYGLTSFPFFVVVGPEGQVRLRVSGELSVADWETLLAVAAAP